mgnify:CR=1 FL=1
MKPEAYLILHDIRSAQNVGAIFRTADACGINKIFLTGYTPAPIDKFGRARSDIAKSALGAEKTIVWQSFKTLSLLFKKFKKENFKIVAIEQAKNSLDYKKIKLTEKIVFIVGNEVTGLSLNILKQCNEIAEIPMKGEKESLNVSVATGIALFRILGV